MKENFSLIGKNILVTGGTGFIGGHLVRKLLDLGANVTVIDIELQPRSVFSFYKLDNKAKLLFLDIRNKDKVIRVFNKYKPEYVFHLAAQSIVGSAYKSPLEALETNVLGTVHILDAARKSPSVKGLIVASSDKAYGKLTKGQYKETDALKGDHPYDVSKSCADLICQAYFKTYNLPVVVTRFGNVYGEGDLHFDRIIPGICESIFKKKTLDIRSNGKYVRDYLYVKDVVDGYFFLLQEIDKIKGEAFNFSSAETLSVVDLVKKAEEILRIKIPYKILNIAKNEIPYQHLDDSKVREIGWNPKYSLRKSLRDIFLWYCGILK